MVKISTTSSESNRKENKAMISASMLLDERLVKLRLDSGLEAVSLYFFLYLYSYQNSPKLRKDNLRQVAFSLNLSVETLRAFISDALDCGLVLEADDFYYIPEVAADLVKLESKRESWRKKKQAQRDAKRDISETSLGMSEKEKEEESEEEGGCKGEGDPKLHPSPTAPKQLTRKKDELKPRDPSGAVWLTDPMFEHLSREWGEEQLRYLIDALADYASQDKSNYRTYRDHARTLRQFRRRELGFGKVFYSDPIHGFEPGFYPRRDVERNQQ